MAATAIYTCKLRSCGKEFTARTADRKRGWALFCCKRCKAIEQEKVKNQGRNIIRGLASRAIKKSYDNDHAQHDHEVSMAAMEDGWDGHKNAF